MKKDTRTNAAVRKAGAPAVPIGEPRMAQQSSPKRAEPSAPVQDWARYADSRLKQFYCR